MSEVDDVLVEKIATLLDSYRDRDLIRTRDELPKYIIALVKASEPDHSELLAEIDAKMKLMEYRYQYGDELIMLYKCRKALKGKK